MRQLKTPRSILALFSILLIGFILLPSHPARAMDKASLTTLAGELFSVDARDIVVEPASSDPPVYRVSRNGQFAGFLASSWQVANSMGYSGRPIDIMIAIKPDGTVLGARLVEQSEPILTLGISAQALNEYVESFAGYDPTATTSDKASNALPDAISGATVSSGVIRSGIIRTVRAVAFSQRLFNATSGSDIKRGSYVEQDWAGLIKDGSITQRAITIGDVRAAMADKELYTATGLANDASFIDLYTGLLTPPTIGRNLLGLRRFNELIATIGTNDHAIFVAANGLYSFKGTNWRKSGQFDRIEIIQGSRTIRLDKTGYRNIERLAKTISEKAPTFREMAVFIVPGKSGFEPSKPWRVSVITSDTDVTPPKIASFALNYHLPERYISQSPSVLAAEKPLWQQNWLNKKFDIFVIITLIAVLSFILFFQDWLTRRYTLYRRVRIGFLLSTFVILGLFLGAQLSVVHVLAFSRAFVSGFSWETFLLDPRAFILWSFIALAMLFWGRGIFCGWLCPFGALQELLNEMARKLKIRQFEFPFVVHERLWPIKYIIFLSLFAFSLYSMSAAFVLAEVEPFKTVITLKFARAWPFVSYALVLLIAGLFIERFYCRYLCPLGAALAIPARLRMFEWLKRRPQCGTQCRICATRCTVQAIHPDGHINPNECIYCLNCQTIHFDNQTCPVLKNRAARHMPKPTPSEGKTNNG